MSRQVLRLAWLPILLLACREPPMAMAKAPPAQALVPDQAPPLASASAAYARALYPVLSAPLGGPRGMKPVKPCDAGEAVASKPAPLPPPLVMAGPGGTLSLVDRIVACGGTQ